jgi:hypothetical protein
MAVASASARPRPSSTATAAYSVAAVSRCRTTPSSSYMRMNVHTLQGALPRIQLKKSSAQPQRLNSSIALLVQPNHPRAAACICMLARWRAQCWTCVQEAKSNEVQMHCSPGFGMQPAATCKRLHAFYSHCGKPNKSLPGRHAKTTLLVVCHSSNNVTVTCVGKMVKLLSLWEPKHASCRQRLSKLKSKCKSKTRRHSTTPSLLMACVCCY